MTKPATPTPPENPIHNVPTEHTEQYSLLQWLVPETLNTLEHCWASAFDANAGRICIPASSISVRCTGQSGISAFDKIAQRYEYWK